MTIILLVLALISVILIGWTLWSVFGTGPVLDRPRHIPRSHPIDHRFQPPYVDAA